MRSSQTLVRTLESLGTRYLFSLSGNQILPIYDACVDSKIDLIHVRHEAAAVHMADAWGRLTGSPGVVLLSAGPGHANALSAMYVAMMAESPIVVISGHAPLKEVGHGPFQELAQAQMSAPVAKAAWVIRDPYNMSSEVTKAFRLSCTGRPGPVQISIPFDILQAESVAHEIQASDSMTACIHVSANSIDGVAAGLRKASRPLVLTGPWVMRSDAYQNALPTLHDAGIPMVGMESPRGVLDPSRGGFLEILEDADFLLLLGMKLEFTLRSGKAPFINPSARVIQIDPDPLVRSVAERNMRDRPHLLETIEGDPLHALELLSRTLTGPPHVPPEWAEQTAEAMTFRPPEWKDIRTTSGDGYHPVEIGIAIDRFISATDDHVFISDGGEFGQWMQACIGTPTRVINGPSGAIGSAIPFALGARLARPSSRIVTCTGDGAFGFHPFEFDTAVRYQLPFIAVIGNDACWNAEYQIQLRDYGAQRAKGCELLPTRYHDVARALGAWGAHITNVAELADALNSAEQSGLPACINVPIRKEPAPIVKLKT